MKRLLISAALIAFSAPCFAQTPPPVDPQVAVYRQLLDNANAQLAAYVAQSQSQISALQKDLAAKNAPTKTVPALAPKPEKKP